MREELYESKFSILRKKGVAEPQKFTDNELRYALRRAVKNTFVSGRLEKNVRKNIENHFSLEFIREKGNL